MSKSNEAPEKSDPEAPSSDAGFGFDENTSPSGADIRTPSTDVVSVGWGGIPRKKKKEGEWNRIGW